MSIQSEAATAQESTFSELLTVEETAKRIGCTKNTVRTLIRNGDLSAVKIGSRMVRIREEDLEQSLRPY